ncbi:MAG: L,D-transpeptidase [Candidatus Sericytochromatia bacterium]|nr:L,D-transpeptidase [Candidatus Sericytochromatia bacterium]
MKLTPKHNLLAILGLFWGFVACAPEHETESPSRQVWHSGGPDQLEATPAQSQGALKTRLKAGAPVALLVDKSAYMMAVISAGKVIKTYPVVFGFGAGPDKLQEGDGATPEGVFRIQNKYPHPDWRYFLWLDYPTADSWHKHKAAKAVGKLASDARIGSEIGIHGVPLDQNKWIDQRKNWTAGCVSLKNTDLQELYPWIKTGTPVKIVP